MAFEDVRTHRLRLEIVSDEVTQVRFGLANSHKRQRNAQFLERHRGCLDAGEVCSQSDREVHNDLLADPPVLGSTSDFAKNWWQRANRCVGMDLIIEARRAERTDDGTELSLIGRVAPLRNLW